MATRAPKALASLSLASLFALFALLAPEAARADAPDITIDGYVALLNDGAMKAAKALSSGDCALACRALESMERAADHICAIDPGPRCADARAKVGAASRRVQEACPGCRPRPEEAPPVRAGKGLSPKDDKPSLPEVKKPPPPPPASPEAEPPPPAPPSAPVTEPAPPSSPASLPGEVSKRGGCAGCAVDGSGDLQSPLAAALLAWVIAARRRSPRRGKAEAPPRAGA